MVTPGLSDGHFHNEGGGHGIDLSPTRSVDGLLAEAGAAGKKAQPCCVSKCFAIVGPSSQDGRVWRSIPFVQMRLRFSPLPDAYPLQMLWSGGFFHHELKRIPRG